MKEEKRRRALTISGTEDIATLRARLISNTTLLNSFIRRLDIATITITIEYTMLIYLDLAVNRMKCKRS